MFNLQDFGVDAPGKLVPIQGGHFAFVPNMLPPELRYEGKIPRLIEAATLALGEPCQEGTGRLQLRHGFLALAQSVQDIG